MLDCTIQHSSRLVKIAAVTPGRPYVGRFRFADAICTGADEKGATFTYARFSCRFLVNYGYYKGRLRMYPTGRTTMRWKLDSVFNCKPRCDSP